MIHVHFRVCIGSRQAEPQRPEKSFQTCWSACSRFAKF
jgi:hypothetical protein